MIESRRAGNAGGGDPAPAPGGLPDGIAALVASWPLDRAEQVASAFTVYFHLANLAEEHQRIRALRERDAPGHPLAESLEATVRQIRGRRAVTGWRNCSPGCGCTRYSPPTPPRHAGGPWSRRCAGFRC